MKKLIAFLMIIIAILLTVMSFTACGEWVSEKISYDHELTDLYNNGELTRNDLKNIAALHVGYVAIVDNEKQQEENYRRINFTPTEPESLTAEQEAQIEKSFKKEQEATVTSYELLDYYGKYGDYYITYINFSLEGLAFTLGLRKLIIDNMYFGYISLGGPNIFYIWKETESV